MSFCIQAALGGETLLSVALQACGTEVTSESEWRAAVADHSSGKYHWVEDRCAFLPTVLLHCRRTGEAARLADPSALRLEPLLAAVAEGEDAALRCVDSWLAAVGKNLGIVDEKGRTSLILATSCGAGPLAIEALLKHGVPADRIDDDGLCAIHYSAMLGDLDALQALLSNGAEPGTAVSITRRTRLVTTSVAGQTALHLACAGRSVDCARALLEAKADPLAKDSDGNLPELSKVGLEG